MDLPQLCNRCGECCIRGGPCIVRKFGGLPEDFKGRCEVLETREDGTTHCPLVAKAFESNGIWSVWATCYIDGNCDFPELRKEIVCASV